MGYRELVSESEAASYAGVSQRTLKRFIESGYLHIEHDADGLPLFDKEEIKKLFGVCSERLVANSSNRIISSEISRNNDKIIDLKLASASGLRSISNRSHTDDEKNAEGRISSSVNNSEDMRIHTEAYGVLEAEIQKLKQVLDLQEHLLEERDREVQQMKGERDWLRKRIERMEEKSERDQILLLSETQTLRKLVNAQVGKKTAFRAMLEWLGLSTPNSQLPVLQQMPPQRQ